MNPQDPTLFVVIELAVVGSVFDGSEFWKTEAVYGPFEGYEAAANWALRHMRHADRYSIEEIRNPNPQSGILRRELES